VGRSKAIFLGPLPADLINNTLGTELEDGDVVITARAQAHIALDHTQDFALVMEHLKLVISAPTYIGQSPHHPEAFELVRRIVLRDTSEIILAAINITRNAFGNYDVHSAYRITQERVDRRVASGHLRNPKK